MKLLLNLIKPKHFIPIHGELRHLHAHAHLAQELGIPPEQVAIIENGRVIEFEDGKMRMGERIPGGYVFVDGSGVGDVGPSLMREREALARDGFVLVNLTLEKSSYRLSEEPEIITRGFVYTRDANELLANMQKIIADTVRGGDGNLQEDLQEALKSFIYNETKRRPMIFVMVKKAGPA
jgi:ribonuclease J